VSGAASAQLIGQEPHHHRLAPQTPDAQEGGLHGIGLGLQLRRAARGLLRAIGMLRGMNQFVQQIALAEGSGQIEIGGEFDRAGQRKERPRL